MNYLASIFLILAILAALFGFGFDSARATTWAGVMSMIFGLGFVSALIVDFLDKRSH